MYVSLDLVKLIKFVWSEFMSKFLPHQIYCMNQSSLPIALYVFYWNYSIYFCVNWMEKWIIRAKCQAIILTSWYFRVSSPLISRMKFRTARFYIVCIFVCILYTNTVSWTTVIRSNGWLFVSFTIIIQLTLDWNSLIHTLAFESTALSYRWRHFACLYTYIINICKLAFQLGKSQPVWFVDRHHKNHLILPHSRSYCTHLCFFSFFFFSFVLLCWSFYFDYLA